MKLLEYEAKSILKKWSIPVPESHLVTLGTVPTFSAPVVLKSQVPVGGRGKAGGVVIVQDNQAIDAEIDRIFQLEIKGHSPSTILAEQVLEIDRELYLSILVNRNESKVQLIAHGSGGIEVEANNQADFLTINFDDDRSTLAIGEQLAEYYDLPGQTFALQDLVKNIITCFVQNDATLIEINPLIVTNDDTLIAGDCKMELDDAARFRHPDWSFEDTPQNTNFVTLNEQGTVATIANGAGLAMATVDAVTAAGMTPANFLDIGGGANTASVLAAFEKIMNFPHVQAIVINIFAGITRCDEVARAIIAAREQIDGLPPLFIRLAGTNFEEAVTLLSAESIATLATLEACLTAAKEVHHG